MVVTRGKFLGIVLAFSLVLSKPADAAQTESFIVYTSITARFAETEITSRVRNDNTSSEQIGFQVILPKEAFISGFSMIISGETYTAEVEDKDLARLRFEEALLQNLTAGLVETRDRSVKTFNTSVNIEAGITVIFKLRYQQLLRRIRGKFRNQLILLGSQLTEYLTIRVDICEHEEIRNIEVPPILDSQGRSISMNTAIDRQRNFARIDFLRGQNPDVITALSSSGGSFAVEYELVATPQEGHVVLSDGYIAFFYSPNITVATRRVIFTLDISGSMSGFKLAQVQEAMRNIIENLTPEDRFTIVVFNAYALAWQRARTLHAATEENIKAAQSFITSLVAGGSTNIDAALELSIDIFNNDVGSANSIDPVSDYIVFLTDGLPSAGETNLPLLQNKIVSSNIKGIPIHVVGFGSNVDADFLERLAARNNGSWTQIFENINAALQIQNFLDELSLGVPYLSDIQMKYPNEILDNFIAGPLSNLYGGGEYTARGRIRRGIADDERGTITLEDNNGIVFGTFDFSLKDQLLSCRGIDSDTMKNFGEKAFALTSVTEVLRQYAVTIEETEKERLKKEALEQSIKAGLVTPVTSLLVIKPKKNVKKRIKRDISLVQKRKSFITRTGDRTPPDYFCQPSASTNDTCRPRDHLVVASRFVVRLSKTIEMCFNLTGYSGEAYNLLHDTSRSIVVNAMVKGKQERKHGAPYRTYITKLLIALYQDSIIITVDDQKVTVKDTSSNKESFHLPLTDISDYETSYGPVSFAISDVNRAHAILNISVRNDIRFLVIIHYPELEHLKDFIHLDLMIHGDKILSNHVGGVYSLFPGTRHLQKGKTASIEKFFRKKFLRFRDRVSPTTQIPVQVPYLKSKTLKCWYIADPSTILRSTISKFKIRGLYDIPYVM